MKSSRLSLVFIFVIAFCSPLSANDFEAALSSETAQFTFRSDSSLIGWGGSDLVLGFFYNEEDDFVLQGSLLQMRQASAENPLTLGVGVKAYLGRLDNGDDILALGIGGQIRYTVPGTMPMAIYLQGHYAPEITSFSDSEEVVDYQLGFQIEALPQTIAFVGVRHLEIDNGSSDYELDDDRLHFGVRLTF
ncbi:MAG: YfaZ family outer membrane protein [Pseudomonadota bacterium]